MSISAVGASTSAYSYLQSLLPPQAADGNGSAGLSDPVSQLLDAFYPNGVGNQSSPSAADPTGSGGGTSSSAFDAGPPFSPDNLSALISAQEQPGTNPFVAASAQSLFTQFDSNGDGQVSKSEFESVFGSNADQSKVDGLFNALDSNGDGSISVGELTSAAQSSHAAHHGHHHHAGGGGGGGEGGDTGGLEALLTSSAQGASSGTTSNPDGSSTTTITYADGSTIALTSPPGSDGSSGSGSDSGTGSGSGSTNDANILEQLIQLQAQSLAASTASNSQILATV